MKITDEQIAERLGGEVLGEAQATGGYFGALALAEDVKRRFKTPSTGGRATDPEWTERRLVRFKRETLVELKSIANGLAISPMQVAALLIEVALLDGDGDAKKEIERLKEHFSENAVLKKCDQLAIQNRTLAKCNTDLKLLFEGLSDAEMFDTIKVERNTAITRAETAEKALAEQMDGQLSPDQIESLKGIGVRVESHGDKNQAVFNDWANKQRKEVDDMKGRMEEARTILDAGEGEG